MKERIQKILNEIKHSVNTADESNYSSVLDEVYEQINLIEYELYSDEFNDVFQIDEDEDY
jgi:hypothetical protein